MILAESKIAQAFIIALSICLIYKYCSNNINFNKLSLLRNKNTKKVSFANDENGENNTECNDSEINENKVANMIEEILKRQLPEN